MRYRYHVKRRARENLMHNARSALYSGGPAPHVIAGGAGKAEDFMIKI